MSLDLLNGTFSEGSTTQTLFADIEKKAQLIQDEKTLEFYFEDLLQKRKQLKCINPSLVSLYNNYINYHPSIEEKKIHEIFMKLKPYIRLTLEGDPLTVEVSELSEKALQHAVHFYIRNSAGVFTLSFKTGKRQSSTSNQAVTKTCQEYNRFFVIQNNDNCISLSPQWNENPSDTTLAKYIFRRPKSQFKNKILVDELEKETTFRNCAIAFLKRYQPFDPGILKTFIRRIDNTNLLIYFHENTKKSIHHFDIYSAFIKKAHLSMKVAKESFQKGLQFFPNDSLLYCTFIWSTWQAEHHKEAKIAYTRACKGGFVDNEIHLTYIEILLKEGKPRAAWKIFYAHVLPSIQLPSSNKDEINLDFKGLSEDGKRTCLLLCSSKINTNKLTSEEIKDSFLTAHASH